jgi:hypothetical protein
MTFAADPQIWALEQFGAAALGHRRRTQRLVELAAQIARHPEGTLPSKLRPMQLKACYRLADQPRVTPAAVLAPHLSHTHRALTAAGPAPVLILHDTTVLDFTDHPRLAGVGPVGDGRGRGLLQHNSLAVDPAGAVLGLTGQQLLVRTPAPAGETQRQRRRRAVESRRWLEGLRAVGPAPAGACWVHVADRESDWYALMAAAGALGHHFLFRVAQDRRIRTGHDGAGAAANLLSYARQLPAQAGAVVAVRARGGRPGREAAVRVAAAAVRVQRPLEGAAGQPAELAVWVVRVWEAGPPAGAEGLEWVLVTSVPTSTAAAMAERLAWYARRWLLEEYHQVEKTGCGEEALRFRTVARLGPVLALLSVVAVRVLQLRQAARLHPEAPAEQVATPAEIAVVRAAAPPRTAGLTVREFVRGVARLGGFLGRKGDGEPGWQTLWRGYQRLQDMVAGYELLQPRSPPDPSCG